MEFKLTEKENLKALEIQKAYHTLFKEWPKVSYTFYQTGMGNKVELNIANKIHDITDYDSW